MPLASQDLDGHRQTSASGIKLPADRYKSLPSSALHKQTSIGDGREGSRDSSTWPYHQNSAPKHPSSRPSSLAHAKNAQISKSSSLSPHGTLSSVFKTDIDADGHDGTPTSSSNASKGPGSPNIHSSQSNILDSPGEDIEFMDGVPSTTGGEGEVKPKRLGPGGHGGSSDTASADAHATPVKYHSSRGLLDMTWLADQTANGARLQDLELDESSVTSLRPDGALEVTTTLEVRQTLILPDVMEEEVDG